MISSAVLFFSAEDNKSGMLGLGLKAKIFGLGLATQDLDFGLATQNLGLVPCGLVNVTAISHFIVFLMPNDKIR